MLTRIDKRKALNYLLVVSNKMNISQKTLCEGILDYSHFNRICNKKEHNISWDLLLNLSARIGVTSKDIFDNCALESSTMYNETFELLDNAKRNHDYKTIKEIINEYKLYNNPSIYEKQLLYYAQAINIAENDKKFEYAKIYLEKAYELTNPFFKLSKCTSRNYSISAFHPVDNELYIYMGMINCFDNDYETKIYLLIDFIKYLDTYKADYIIQTRLYYNLARSYYCIEAFNDARDTLLKSINSLPEGLNNYEIAKFYYLLAITDSHLELDSALDYALIALDLLKEHGCTPEYIETILQSFRNNKIKI